MCYCFSFSFSKHTLDDVCLSLVFKSVLNSVTFDNCCRFWKCAKQKIMYVSSSSHTQKGSMFFRPSPPDICQENWDFSIANRKKVSLTLSSKYSTQTQRQQFFTDSDQQTGLVWKDFFCVQVFLFSFFFFLLRHTKQNTCPVPCSLVVYIFLVILFIFVILAISNYF